MNELGSIGSFVFYLGFLPNIYMTNNSQIHSIHYGKEYNVSLKFKSIDLTHSIHVLYSGMRVAFEIKTWIERKEVTWQTKSQASVGVGKNWVCAIFLNQEFDPLLFPKTLFSALEKPGKLSSLFIKTPFSDLSDNNYFVTYIWHIIYTKYYWWIF